MDVKVIGAGCPDCDKLKASTEAALKELGIKAEIQRISSLKEIVLLGVIMVVTFILLFDKEAPRVPNEEKLEQAMQFAAKAQDFCTEILPFLPLILIGTLALGFIALTLLYKRREK